MSLVDWILVALFTVWAFAATALVWVGRWRTVVANLVVMIVLAIATLLLLTVFDL